MFSIFQEQSFWVSFDFKDRSYRVLVNAFYIDYVRPRRFYRLGISSGNRDIILHEGQWIVVSGKYLPNEVLDGIGAGIEKWLSESKP